MVSGNTIREKMQFAVAVLAIFIVFNSLNLPVFSSGRTEIVSIPMPLPEQPIEEITFEPRRPPRTWYYEDFISIADVPAFTEDDKLCMAKNIYFEARNEPLRGQIAVALVTLNRVKSSRFPDSVCDVVYQHKQFSWYSDGLSDRPKNREAWEYSQLIAGAILDVDFAVEDFTNGSTHYHADYVEPYWAAEGAGYVVQVVQVETHIFYREL